MIYFYFKNIIHDKQEYFFQKKKTEKYMIKEMEF